MLNKPQRPDLVELSGTLAPDLEAAAHSQAHPGRVKRSAESIQNRGDRPSVPTADSPSAPKRR